MEDYQVAKEKEMYKSKINFFINLVHEIRTPTQSDMPATREIARREDRGTWQTSHPD